jgi:dGTPase
MSKSRYRPEPVIHVTLASGYSLEENLSPIALKSSGLGSERDVTRCRQIARDTTAGSDRLPFEHDRDRIIHCRQFRKLAGKTQLLILPNRGDLRTRLTHTMEVYQLATSLGRRLNLNIPAIEAISLGHDTGHTPFGHAGEAALDEILKDIGGFHHAAHSVRSLDHLAYDSHILENEDTCGLNLTWAVREGIFKHGWYANRVTPYHKPPLQTLEWDLETYRPYGSSEAQVVALADQIAYLNHDLEDLVLYGFEKILSAGTLEKFFTRHKIPSSKGSKYSNWHDTKQQFLTLLTNDEPTRVKTLVRDAVDASVARIERVMAGKQGQNAERLIEFSPVVRRTRDLFYSFFKECVYDDVRIQTKNENAQKCVRFLHNFFERLYAGNNELLPMHIHDELAAAKPWWEIYLTKRTGSTPKSKRKESSSNSITNTQIACKLASADVVADLTDPEALAAARALGEAESTAGVEVLDRILATFPNHRQADMSRENRLDIRKRLRQLLKTAGD